MKGKEARDPLKVQASGRSLLASILPEPHTRQLFMVALCTTAVIFGWIAKMRTETADPYDTEIFRFLVRQQDFHALMPFALLLVIAFAPRIQFAGRALARWLGCRPGIAALATMIVLAVAARVVYHAHPLAMDEYAPYFQSQVLAAGELAGRYPPELIDRLVPKPFQEYFFRIARDTGDIASTYWPGFALLLVPFTSLGAPWLLNPLIGGGTVLVMHRLGREMFADDESAGLVVLFTIASTAVTVNAISLYSMPAHLLASALYVLLLLKPTGPKAFAAGLVGSLALILHNPVPHILFALPWILWVATRPGRFKLLAALAAGYVPLCLVIGWGWNAYLASLAHAASAAASASPGRATEGALQSALDSLQGMARFLKAPNAWIIEARFVGLGKLWLWAAPAMAALAAFGMWRSRNDTGLWLVLCSSALLTFGGYLLVPLDQGHGWGFRYFHAAWLTLPLFAVRALDQNEVGADASERLRNYAAGCALLGLVVMTSVQGFQVERFIARHLAQLPEVSGAGERIVFIDTVNGYYAVDLVQNDPYLRSQVTRFVSKGRAADEALMRERFPQFALLSADTRGSVWGPAAGADKGR